MCWKGWHSLSAWKRSGGSQPFAPAQPAQYSWGMALGNPAWRRPVQRQALLSLWNYSTKAKCAKPLSAIHTQRYSIPPGAVARRRRIHRVTLGILSLLYKTETGMLHSSPFASSDWKLSEAGVASYTHGPCLAQWTLILAGHYCNTQ